MHSATRKRLLLSVALVIAAMPGAGASTTSEHLALCGVCHGVDGNSVSPEYPVLAGASVEYLTKQVTDFKAGARKNVLMTQIMTTLDPASLEEVVTYFSEQARRPAPVEPDDAKADPAVLAEMVARGKEIFELGIPAANLPECASCHGFDGMGDNKAPRLAGQHTTYEIRQLGAFKAGERSNDLDAVMRGVAAKLSEADILAVSHYVTTLQEDPPADEEDASAEEAP
jgi:cytochrome c553